jgi:prepilin peptidase CpaA
MPLTIGFLLVGTILAAYFDVTRRRIPNWISGSILAYGIAGHVWIGGWTGLVVSVAGLAVGGGILMVLYLIGGMGAGDVKLLAAIGSVIGPYSVFLVLILASLVGGVLAVVALGSWNRWPSTAHRFVRLLADAPVGDGCVEKPSAAPPVTVPYGVAISVGTWIFMTIRGDV